MHIKFLVGSIILTSIIFQIISCSKDTASKNDKNIVPKTVQKIELIKSLSSPVVKDLSEIVIALEKYKMEKKMYPLSKNDGRDWNRYIYEKSGSIDEEWIPGLAPNYIKELPHDRRENPSWGAQYVYKSNGAHYKLVSLIPGDCEIIKQQMPEMIDPKREQCIAYGFWTEGAKNW